MRSGGTFARPCCGLNPIPDETRCGAWYLQCDHCGRVKSGPTLQDAVASWNKGEKNAAE